MLLLIHLCKTEPLLLARQRDWFPEDHTAALDAGTP